MIVRTYKSAQFGNVLRDDGAFVPISDTTYLDWLAQGNTPLPADPVPNPAIAAIDAQLADIDFRSIRPVREGDAVFLATLTAQAVELRAARALLQKTV